jgi:hypothetical protein
VLTQANFLDTIELLQRRYKDRIYINPVKKSKSIKNSVFVCTDYSKFVRLIKNTEIKTNNVIVLFGSQLDLLKIKGAIVIDFISDNFKLSPSYTVKYHKMFSVIEEDVFYPFKLMGRSIHYVLEVTMPIDLITLIQSALYIAASKSKRSACRRYLVAWIQEPNTEINSYLIAGSYNKLPETLQKKFNTWAQLKDKPNYKEFIKKSVGLPKKELIALGQKYKLSSFEAITLPGYAK